MKSARPATGLFFSSPAAPDPLSVACGKGAACLAEALVEAAVNGRAVSAFTVSCDVERSQFSVPERERLALTCLTGISRLYSHQAPDPEAVAAFAQLARHLIAPSLRAGTSAGLITHTEAARTAALACKVFEEQLVLLDPAAGNARSNWLRAADELGRLSSTLAQYVQFNAVLQAKLPNVAADAGARAPRRVESALAAR